MQVGARSWGVGNDVISCYGDAEHNPTIHATEAGLIFFPRYVIHVN